MPLTFDDPSIVFDINKGMILEASAGSGKTTILTERWLSSFLYLIVWEKKTVSEALHSIIALTFTKKAATEMKIRIRNRINELWSDNELELLLDSLKQYNGEYPTSQENIIDYVYTLKDQIEDLFSGTKIMTINAYVLYLLRSYPLELNHDIGLTPEEGSYEFSASEQEIQLTVYRNLLQQNYPEYQGYFQLGVKLVGLNKFITILEQIRKLVSQYGRDAIKNSLNNSYYFLYEDNLKEAVKKGQNIHIIYDLILPSVNALIETLERENICKSLSTNRKLYHRLKNFSLDNLLEIFSKDLLGQYKLSTPVKNEELNILRENSYYAYQNLIETLYRIIIPLVFEISELCSDELKKLQIEYGEISFGDSEITLLDSLKNPYFLAKIQENLKFFFVDEFQDTSDLQKEIFDLIISKANIVPLFVGDPKQSIYSFRKANVYVFSKTVQEFQMRSFEHKFLNTNYRSVKSHVDLINFLFTNIFTNDHTGIIYQNQLSIKDEEGYFAYTLALGIDDNEKYLTQDKLEKSFYDALYFIQQLLAQNISPGDILLLFRNRTSILGFYLFVKKYDPNLPLSSSVRDILWDNKYILPLLSFLKVLLNPYDTLTLIELLKTPIFRKNDIQINEYLVYAQKQNKSLFDILEDQEFKILREFIVLRDRISLEELIFLLIEELHYEEYLDLISETGEAKATLSLFIEEAQKLQEKREMNLGDFIFYINNKKTNIEEAEFAGEVSKTLRLMTIHSSKGLESPYVIYVHKPKLKEEILKFPIYQKNKVAFDILGKGLLADELGKEYLKEFTSEEKRLAYVAVTRAKKKFIFCALPTIVKSSDNIFETQWASFINKELIEKDNIYASGKIDPNIDLIQQESQKIQEDTTSYQERYEWLLEKDKQFIRQEYPQFLSVSLLLDVEFNSTQFHDKYIKRSFNLDESLRELGDEDFSIHNNSQQDIGTLIHLLLQHFDVPSQDEAYAFLEKYHPDKKEIFPIVVSYAFGYWESTFYQNIMKDSKIIDKERQVSYLLPHDIVLRSTADLYVSSTNDQYIIVDYKLSVGKNLERYYRQLSYYALLSEKANQPVNQLILFSLKDAKVYHLDWNREDTEKKFYEAIELFMQMIKQSNNIDIDNLKQEFHQLTSKEVEEYSIAKEEWKDTLF